MRSQLLSLFMFFVCSIPLEAQTTLSVPFNYGFIGTQGANPQQADNISLFSTLQITNASFIQESSGSTFELQGNDISGTLRLTVGNASYVDVPGAIVWRITTGSTLEFFGFIPDSNVSSDNLSNYGGTSYVFDNTSNYGLRLVSSTLTYVDGDNVSGNAATNGLLDALNDYLLEVQNNSPSGPITVDDLTTTDTTPTLTGNVTLGANENLKVSVDGVTYDTSSGLNISGNDWTLDIPSSLNYATYEITAILTNDQGYTLENQGTLVVYELVIIVDSFPTAVCQDITVELDSNGAATITASDVDGGSSDVEGPVTLSITPNSFTCNDVGVNSVVLWVTDSANQIATCAANVTIQDNIVPTVVTQDATLQLDANGVATLTTNDIDNGSSDNCGVASLSLSQTSFNCSDVGVNTVILTVVDDNGNSNTGTATVTVEDTVNPTAVCQDVTLTLDGNGTAALLASDIDGGSTDNCSISSLSASQTSFGISDLGINTVTLTVTDSSGNTSTCTATVTVVDTTDPTAVCQDITVELDSNGAATIAASDVDGGSSDNGGAVTLSITPNSFTCNDVGVNSVVLTVTDAAGNTATCTANVTIQDNIVPTVVTQDATLQLDANGVATLTTNDIDNGSSDNCGVASLSLSQTSFNCSDVGVNTVILTVVDDNGNSNTGTATVTVNGPMAPIGDAFQTFCSGATFEEIDATGENILWYLTSTGGAPVDLSDLLVDGQIIYGSQTTGGCESAQRLMVTVSIIEVHVTATETEIYIGENSDLTATYSAALNDIVGCTDMSLENFAEWTELAATGGYVNMIKENDIYYLRSITDVLSSDNLTGPWTSLNFVGGPVTGGIATMLGFDWDGKLFVSTSHSSLFALNQSNVWQDMGLGGYGCSGNAITKLNNGRIIVSKYGYLRDLYISDDNGLNWTNVTNADNDYKDLILASNGTIFAAGGSNTASMRGVIKSTDNGNSFQSISGDIGIDYASTFATDCSNNIYVVGDNKIFKSINNGENWGLYSNTPYNSTPVIAFLEVISQDIMYIYSNYFSDNQGDVGGLYKTIDGGNTWQIVNLPIPTINEMKIIDGKLIVIGDQGIFGLNINSGFEVLWSTGETSDSINVSPTETTEYWVDVTANGNTCRETITIIVNTTPPPTGEQVQTFCDNPAVSDLVVNGQNIIWYDSPTGGNIIDFEDILIHGQLVYASQTINGFESQDRLEVFVEVQNLNISGPVSEVCANDMVELTVIANVLGTYMWSTGDDTESILVMPNETTEYWVDVTANNVTCRETITIFVDSENPVVVTQDITIELDPLGLAIITPMDIDNGSIDNCSIETYSLDIDTFDCDDVGPNIVTLTIIDSNGNSAQATAVVTVVDVTPPVIVCAPDVITVMDPGVCYAEVYFADALALDECGIASVVQTAGPASGSLFTQGVTTIEYTATDVNGNTTVCFFTVNIQDTQIPTIVSSDDITVSNDLGICGAFITVPPPTITDNCSLDPAPVVDGPVTPLSGASQLLDTPSTVSGLSNSIGGAVTAVVTYNGDWSASFEDFDLRGPDGSQVFFRDNQGVDCPGIDFEDTFSISEATWNGWITTYGSDLTFTLLADPSVNPGLCTNNFYHLSFTLGNGALLVNDYNGTADASDEYPVGTTTVTWTFTDVGGNVVTDTQDITVTDDEAPEMICIGEPGTFNIYEDFETSTLPNGWTNIALRGSDLWTFGSGDMSGAIGDFPTNAAIFDDDAAGPGVDNAVQLISPTYNMSGALTATLSFDYAYNFLSGAEFFSAEIFDGTDWIEILFLQEDVNPTNTGAIDVSAYVNDAFQVRFTYDDGGSGWKWSAGIDNFQLDYDIPSTPLTIALDANGEVTLDVSQLLLSATDNCGPVSTSIGGGAVPGSLTTIFDGGNGGADGGAVYFDVAATADLTLESLQMHIQDPGTFTVQVYAIEGDTYVGNETNSGAWTLVSTGTGESNSTGAPSDVTLDTTLSLTNGTTYAMALILDATHSHRYTNGDGTNENFSDANLSISLGAASNAPFTGTIFSPRVFNGTLNYFVGAPPSTSVDFDCSNLGDNLIEVTATDSSGNVSSCISTVEVIDVTDPILVCQDATVGLDENGMAEVLPEYFIDTDASFDACGITITAVDITDVTCADIGAPITVTVFVSDASGNIASCQATMTVVDDMGPLIIDCPEDMTVDPGPLDLFYELPDYTVDISATDNCTDPVGLITQDPPAGTLLPDGIYTITLSATDNEGNIGSCSFELTVESQLGVASNQLNAGVDIYPNPARKVMNIGNSTDIQLELALIYDLNGRLIQSVDLGNMDREISVNVANLASGVYLVQLEAQGVTAIRRLIKE